MEPMSEYAQLQLRFVDSIQRRYEVIRPIILLGERTAAQRVEETQLHPETVRDLTRRFRQQGMLALAGAHGNRYPQPGQGGLRKSAGGTGAPESALRWLWLSRIGSDSLAPDARVH